MFGLKSKSESSSRALDSLINIVDILSATVHRLASSEASVVKMARRDL